MALKLNNDQKPRIIKQPEIGQLTRELRLKTGLTQEKFAARLGVTCPTVNRWENGPAKPSPMAIERIEEMLRSLSRPGAALKEQSI